MLTCLARKWLGTLIVSVILEQIWRAVKDYRTLCKRSRLEVKYNVLKVAGRQKNRAKNDSLDSEITTVVDSCRHMRVTREKTMRRHVTNDNK